MEQKPLFITFEGIDGSGTTTQVRILKERLSEKNLKVYLTGEPTQGPIGSLIRNILKKRIVSRNLEGEEIPFHQSAIALLFAADRIDHYYSEIHPMLKENFIVISDRYVLSSLAYQSLDNPVLWVKEINRFAPLPDITIFIDIPVEVSIKRIQISRPFREIYETEEKQKKILQLYRESFSYLKEKELFVVDGNREKHIVGNEIFEFISKFLLN